MDISSPQVRQLYERRPYPHYPLLAKPQWQDGYLGSSMFAKSILGANQTNPNGEFLSIGCGEMLPYIIRQWEPSQVKLTCVDLSKRSLNRARFRTMFLGRKIELIQEDINSFLQSQLHLKAKYFHMEAYGVLHHISTFKTTLHLMSERLEDGGICRIMVYNSHARDWIWDINRAMRQLGFDFDSNDSISKARLLLKELQALSPRLKQRIDQMGQRSLQNNSRFADTFLHPWEARTTIQQWFDYLTASGFRTMALHDRYAELDDLVNPMWQCPSAQDLTERALDLRFENNLELWVTKNSSPQRQSSGSSLTEKIPLRLSLQKPTHRFSQYSETKILNSSDRSMIWKGFINELHHINDRSAILFISQLEARTAKRLARMGLILPAQAKKAGRYEELLAPMEQAMKPPSIPPTIDSSKLEQVTKICEQHLKTKEKGRIAALRLMRVL